ncbi:hypothetical protein [Bradyrhizobium sp. CCBAU 11386]|uniref:hypothetical protein n=1 Tax=Bradyrhizobium sp. CCBAU 11386 TaxID=1630837 RepID=UPI0023036F54|nr:hypothetical protein [Bradyrhizobium sp. CCBAU 11386]
MADFDGLSDHFILRMYEFIRHEVLSDASAGSHLVGLAARQRADGVLKEINRRGLLCKPIDWPEHLTTGADHCQVAIATLKTTSS